VKLIDLSLSFIYTYSSLFLIEMVQYIRAKCLIYGDVVVLTYDQEPTPSVEKGGVFEVYRCPACGTHPNARFRSIERFS